MAKYPFAYGCMEWAALPWVGGLWINSCMMVTWNCMRTALCWEGGTGRALERAQTAQKWEKSSLGAQGPREEWGEKALRVSIKASAGDGELLQTRV